MIRRLLTAVAAVVFSALPATAQNMPAPVGLWDCVMNGPTVSIQLRIQVAPDSSVFGQGSITYIGTSRIYQVRGPGRWSPVPPEAGAPRWTYGFQIQPQNHAIFTIYAAPTNQPNYLYNVYNHPHNGSVTETACTRIG